MGKVYVVKNVYDATIERLEKIFSENFAEVCQIGSLQGGY